MRRNTLIAVTLTDDRGIIHVNLDHLVTIKPRTGDKMGSVIVTTSESFSACETPDELARIISAIP